MKISVPKESIPGESRVALTPEVAGKLAAAGGEVLVEQSAGAAAGFPDSQYSEAGATLTSDTAALWDADVVLKVAGPTEAEIAATKDGQLVIGFLAPLTAKGRLEALAARRVNAIAVESVPRITRAQSMDALSSQSTVSGYRAALLAATEMQRFFPMLTTAAGTIRPAKVLVLGAGVAGLQAIATTRRLGAIVTGFDVRAAVKEQVESLGAKFLELEMDDAETEGGYARALTEEEQALQLELLGKAIADMDAVISTALVPGKPAPRLITADAVEKMKPGSVVIDLAAETGGNCDLTRPGETVVEHDVKILGRLNLPSEMAQHASQLYARNLESLLALLIDEGTLKLDFEDEIVAGACVVHDGKVRV